MGYGETNLQRRMEIENTFLLLMREENFDSITVKDLTQRIGIARKTFYSYFPNKHACLDSLTDRLIYECTLEILQSMPSKLDMTQFFRNWITFWMENKPFLEAIRENYMTEYLVQRLMAYIYKEHSDIQELLTTAQLPCDSDILYYCVSGITSLTIKWCLEDFPLSPDEMAAKLLRLSVQPLISITM